jgi:hypothetical protein
MHRPGQSRPSEYSHRRARRPRLLLEPLESRRMLSTATAGTIITPNVTPVTADLSALRRGHQGGLPGGGVTNPTPASTALTPAQIASAYHIILSSSSASGQTIAIVDAYNDPNILADLAAFDTQYNLPAANITVQNQYGQTTNLPSTDSSWSLEIALDVEWAHAAAPGAKILLVEANSASTSDLMTAVQTAAAQASVVSMSWGGSEFAGEKAYDTAAYFANPNVTFIAASGDDGGASGASWPAVSPYVLSVGGTTLSLTSAGTISSETAWNASGSRWSGYSGSTGGVSLYESLPSYQATALGGSTTNRATPDVSAVANPNTGLAVYDSVPGMGQTGWFQVGGTSAGAPLWAGIIAAADQARAAVGKGPLSSTQTLSMLYGVASSSSYSSNLRDITSGSNFVASAKKGYDMVTGLGSPVASALVATAAAYTGATTPAVKKSLVTALVTAATTATSQVLPLTTTPSSTPVVVSSVVLLTPITTAAPAAALPASPAAPVRPTVSTAAFSTATTRVAQPIPSPAQRTWSVGTSTAPGNARGSDWWNKPGLPSQPSVKAVVAHTVETQTFAPTTLVLPLLDASLEDYVAESLPPLPAELTPEPATAAELEESESSSRPLIVAAAAVALWGVWEYRSRRSDRDRPRRTNASIGQIPLDAS